MIEYEFDLGSSTLDRVLIRRLDLNCADINLKANFSD